MIANSRRFRLGGVAVCLAVLPFWGCAGPQKKMKQEAQARWDGIRAKVKVRLASDDFEQGEVDEALKQLSEATELDPDSPGAAILLAKIQLAKGQLAAARVTLDEAEADWGATAEIPYLRGVLEERAGRPQEAFQAYRTAFEAEPDHTDYFVAVCESMLALGMARQTVAWMNLQEEAHGQTGIFHVLMGRALRLAGRYAEAADAYEMAAEMGAADDGVTEARALCLMWAERYAEAARLLHTLLADDPVESRPSLQLAYCRCLLESGEVERARERLALLSRVKRDSTLLWQLMARAAWAQGDGPEALRHARRAAALEETAANAHLMVATFAYRLGRRALARDATQKVLRADPTNPLGLRLRRELNRVPAKVGRLRGAMRRLVATTARVLRTARRRLARAGFGAPITVSLLGYVTLPAGENPAEAGSKEALRHGTRGMNAGPGTPVLRHH